MKVSELCRLVRAKNAGPFRVTIDCFCKDAASYAQLEATLDGETVATALGVDARSITRFALQDLQVIKFGLARPVIQGSLGDRDLHGAQWAHVIADLSAGSSPTPASRHIATVTLVVKDYDEAIGWFTQKLGFTLEEDSAEADKRWVIIAAGSHGTRLLLALATDDNQLSRVGNQTGGRVAFFLETDDLERDYSRFKASGVHFLERPRREAYGTVVVFEDVYGNRWDLLQPIAEKI